jgi:hypothetical protein
MAATATLELDPDLFGPLLVREIEAYLAAIAPEPAWRARLRAAIAEAHTVPATSGAGAAEPWWHGAPVPTQTFTGRLLRRRPTIRVTVRQHLELMDRYIAHHGWTQGQLWTETDAVCVLGAHIRVLAAGYGDASTTWRARLAIGNALGRLGKGQPVDTWNDQPTTQLTDVHALLRAAAARV